MTKTIPNTPCPAYLQDTLRRLTPLGGRVLDVASGLACYHLHITERCRELVCVDAFPMYLEHAKTNYPEQVKQTYLGRAQDVLPTLEDDAYDLALAIDFLEHMEKPESAFVVEQMKRVAPLVAVCVPRGNHPQDHDWLGNGADELQKHRSQWDVGDLEAMGFEEELWQNFHAWAWERYANVEGFSPDALFGVWRLT